MNPVLIGAVAVPALGALAWAAKKSRLSESNMSDASGVSRVGGDGADMRTPHCNTASDAKASSPEAGGWGWNGVKKVYDESPDIRGFLRRKASVITGFFLKNSNNEQDTKNEGAENNDKEEGFLKRRIGWPWINMEKGKELLRKHQEVMIGLAVLSGIGIGLAGLNLVLQNQTLRIIKALACHAYSGPKVEIKV